MMLERLGIRIAGGNGRFWLAALAFVLCLPALRYGLQADDVLFPWKLERGTSPWMLFQMESDYVREARERGFVVWWSNPALEIKFLRPLSSVSHALEFALYPHAAWLMHLANAMSYALAVLVAALLYRRFAPSPAAAGLGALLFAIDDGHAFSAGWIAGRNTVLALLFALLALELHARARESGARSFAIASTLAVAAALGSGEAGVWALALLASYAVCYESGSWIARARTLLPALAVALVWAGAYVALDCGLRGSSFYRDPSDPLTTLMEGSADVPVWFSDLFGLGGVPLSLLYPTFWIRIAMAVVSVGLFWLLWPPLRTQPACRFFALATGLCIIPLFCTLPTSRVLMGPSFGAMGWIACAILDENARAPFGRRILVALHLVLAPLMFLSALGATEVFAYGSKALANATTTRGDVIVVQTPVELLSNYALLELTSLSREQHAPRSLHQLYSGSSPLVVERIDAHTLELEVRDGWGRVPIERVFCARDALPKLGSTVERAAFTARIVAVNAEGLPTRVRFTFPSPLESPDRQWLTWNGNRPVQFRPPASGQRTELAPLSFFSALQP